MSMTIMNTFSNNSAINFVHLTSIKQGKRMTGHSQSDNNDRAHSKAGAHASHKPHRTV